MVKEGGGVGERDLDDEAADGGRAVPRGFLHVVQVALKLPALPATRSSVSAPTMHTTPPSPNIVLQSEHE